MNRKRLALNGLLGVSVVAAGVTGYTSLGTSSAARATPVTATVTRGIVLASVSATGNVSAATELGLNFASGGRLTEVDVKPGDHVTKGQTLARVDDRAARDALATAQANLASARARLALDEQGVTAAQRAQDQASADQAQAQIDSAQTSLANAQATAAQDAVNLQAAVDQAKGAVDAAKATAAQNAIGYQTAVDQANAQLSADQNQLAADQSQLATDQNQLATDQAAQASAQSAYDTDTANVAQDQADQHGCAQSPPVQPQRSATCSDVAYTLQQDQARQQADNSRLNDAKQAVNTDKGAVSADKSKVSGDQAKVTQDQNALTNAQNNQAAGTLKDQQAVTNAQNTLTNAQNNQAAGTLKDQQAVTNAQSSLSSARAGLAATLAANAIKESPATAATIAADQASIAGAQASVGSAQRTLDDTTLVAPADGTVASVASTVGELVGSGGGGSSSSGGSATSSSGTASSSASGFIVLADLGTPQVKAGFSEADAAKVHLGQPATVTFDALPGERAAGTVAGIDVNQTVVSNVVTYNVTVLLSQRIDGLKPGMTSSAQVTIAERDGVLKVPSAAVSTRGGASTVTVLQGTRETTRTVAVGLKGDDATEILDGVTAGEKVVTSTGTAGSTPAGLAGRLTGGFGGGLGGAGVRIGGGR